MGKLFKAALGFAIALTLLQGKSVWAGLDNPHIRQMRADIAAELDSGSLVQSGTGQRHGG